MTDQTVPGDKINALLQEVLSIEDRSGDAQLTLMVYALVIACRSCQVGRFTLSQQISEAWERTEGVPLVPLDDLFPRQ